MNRNLRTARLGDFADYLFVLCHGFHS
jgi:hypothetical protein